MASRKKSRKKQTGKFSTVALVLVAIAGLALCYLLFGSMARQGKRQYIYIDDDDNMDSVCTKLAPLSTAYGMATFKMLAGIGSYASNIKTGRYEVGSSGALMTFRRMRNGMQAPVSITIGSVRTTDKLAHMVSRKLMFSSDELLRLLRDKDVCGKYGYTPDNVIAMFIPNTYDIYWNSSASSFLDRMQRESKRFWTAERREKASTAGLSPLQVMTLASIVSEETANEEEMPSVAGMYINRLEKGMLLQADPTVKFATRQFEARRIYNSMLRVDNPYNTYRYKGLPPGPIRIPTVAAIDAVLNYRHHDYLYMCAKEDFSGTHNFASTYEEHKKNAARYAKALNERGIK